MCPACHIASSPGVSAPCPFSVDSAASWVRVTDVSARWPRSRRLSRTTDNLRELASAVSIVADLTTSLA